jgi:hypothetical protein
MLFPQGTFIQINDSLRKAFVKKTSDGRSCLEISFSPQEADQIDVVTVSIRPTALYIVAIFIPCILSLIITIILVLVIYIIRKKRRRGKSVSPHRAPQEISYEDQDYYVPPPPPQSRK